MSAWTPIEEFLTDSPIWVIKYDLYSKDGKFVNEGTEGAEKFTSCHGWYETEEDAYKVVNHFPNPNAYKVEKVHKRKLKTVD